MQFDETLGDRQSQTSPLSRFAGIAQTIERLKDALLLVGCDARPVIAHGDPNAVSLGDGRQLNPAARGSELDGIAQQIEEDLFEPRNVTTDRDVPVHPWNQLVGLFIRQRSHYAQSLAERRGQVDA